ncbi:MAG: tRNA dihydrouridine(20/20a) synthase DusA [Pseudomonadota bacterium]
MTQNGPYRFCVAPMMDWTDRHCRAFHRVLTKRARLYTEMITANAVRFGDRSRLLDFHASEHPVALQLGGADPGALAEAARIGADWGYDEINLNVGCPSDRVQSGHFGAALMAEPKVVAECVAAIASAVACPVTVKCRIGIDDQTPSDVLPAFLKTVADAGAGAVIVHARKAWLQGLSPKQNRDIPPLDYPLVHRMKSELPGLTLVLNGGLETLAMAAPHLQAGTGVPLDGVMLGRAAYQTPDLLADVDRVLFGDAPGASRCDAVRSFFPYLEARLGEGVRLHAMTRHMVGLFQGQPGARAWRRHLSTEAVKPGAGPDVVETALGFVEAFEGEAAARHSAQVEV